MILNRFLRGLLDSKPLSNDFIQEDIMNAKPQLYRKYPCDDQIMEYDLNTHRYVLTKNGVLSELGENLDLILNATGDAEPSTLAARFLRRVSQVVYSYLYRYTQSEAWLEYILATYPPLRARVKEMLQAQTLYMLANGDIGLMSGVNVAKGHAMDINALRGRARVAPEVEDLAGQFVPGLGYALNYAGELPCVPCELYRRGY